MMPLSSARERGASGQSEMKGGFLCGVCLAVAKNKSVKKTSSAASSDESFNVGGINVKMSLRERFKTKRKAEMSLASGMFVSARIISKGTVVLRLILDLRFFFFIKRI